MTICDVQLMAADITADESENKLQFKYRAHATAKSHSIIANDILILKFTPLPKKIRTNLREGNSSFN